MFTILVGSLSAFKEGVIPEKLPNTIVVGCVCNTTYTLTSSTLLYTLTVSQIPCFLWIRSLEAVCTSMFGGTRNVNIYEDSDVPRPEYDKGYALDGFNLVTDHGHLCVVS